MCTGAAAVGTALSVGGQYLGMRGQVKGLQAQYDAQRQAAVTNMNYQLQNLENQRVSAFDAAVNQLTKIKQQSQTLVSGVKAAVAENMEGRTARLLVRNAEGDNARAADSVKDNYTRKSNEIDLNKESAYLSAKSSIDNLGQSVRSQAPSSSSFLLGAMGTALGNYTSTMNQLTKWNAEGLTGENGDYEVNYWSGLLQKKKKGFSIDGQKF